MKLTSTLGCLLFSTFVLFGQDKKIEPLIISGQITNSIDEYMTFTYVNEDDEEFHDTLKLDAAGTFYLKTFRIQVPQTVVLIQKNFPGIVVFVAPGYNLTIKGNRNDKTTSQKSPEITGVGAEPNRYTSLLDSVNRLSGDTIGYGIRDFAELKDFVFYLVRIQKTRDSVAGVVFDRKNGRDEYLKYFGDMIRTDNQFNTNYFIVQYLTSITGISPAEAIVYLKANFSNCMPANLSRDEYLHSGMFKFFLQQYYGQYVLASSKNTDSALKIQSLYNFEAIQKSYTGKVQEYLFYIIMKRMNRNFTTVEQLNRYQAAFMPFQKTIENSYYKRHLEELFAQRKKELMPTKIGMPAPLFTLKDNFNKEHRLSDFKGKVVYLDLWASWCGPCRAETPAFKTLFDKYKNDDRVAFISIAVADKMDDWKKALATDKPQWLQLIDKNDSVKISYDANPIPKFILISKEGYIINSNAPRPSDAIEIEKLINQEISK